MRFRTKKINLVLLGGRAGVGKTTAALFLQNSLRNYPSLKVDHTAFATSLKEIARNCFGWDGVKDEKGRRLLQVIGTDAGRTYDEDIWVKKTDDHLLTELPHFAFIDDWRFPNEKSFYEKSFMYDITTIRIERPVEILNQTLSCHPSENSIPSAETENLVYNKDSYYNFSIFNSGTMEDFNHKLGSVLDYLKTKLVEY